MKRTTIFVPEALERDLQLYARREGKPAAAVVREAVAAYIARPASPARLPSFAGAFDSGHSDTAQRHDELLFNALTPHDVRLAARPKRGLSGRSRRSTKTRR